MSYNDDHTADNPSVSGTPCNDWYEERQQQVYGSDWVDLEQYWEQEWSEYENEEGWRWDDLDMDGKIATQTEFNAWATTYSISWQSDQPMDAFLQADFQVKKRNRLANGTVRYGLNRYSDRNASRRGTDFFVPGFNPNKHKIGMTPSPAAASTSISATTSHPPSTKAAARAATR